MAKRDHLDVAKCGLSPKASSPLAQRGGRPAGHQGGESILQSLKDAFWNSVVIILLAISVLLLVAFSGLERWTSDR